MKQYNSSSISFPISWHIKREPVYRLLDNVDYIENFFRDGEIMISCFNNFKKNPDEMQGDNQEGHAIVGEFGNSGFSNHIIYESGKNAYVMSTTKEITKKVIKDFNAVGAIKITNPAMFGHEIAKKLPFVNSGVEGSCDYETSRVHFLEGEAGKILNKLDWNDPHSHQVFQEITMGMELFLKLEKYKHQQEYRFAWFSKTDVENSIIVKCPEASLLCEKIIF
ncbi:hypothetical protein FMM05_08710 [Flavobacterium zepuense]|uniref:Uncharacterized protein n=1 Tax=Flavobacterium zepuense TaxID=2593302 RepID=A0A552V4G9_9FLAO|nr:hypothetical protein [Flavobacterium zepuense]TRW25374.1 hypothetical protein FMM05_08710 [Flavobacterium zepuense]